MSEHVDDTTQARIEKDWHYPGCAEARLYTLICRDAICKY